jgi:hypothetical protein
VRTLAAGYEEVRDVLASHLADDPGWGCQVVVRTDEGVVGDLAPPARVVGEVAREDVVDLLVTCGEGPHHEAHLTAPPVTPAAM